VSIMTVFRKRFHYTIVRKQKDMPLLVSTFTSICSLFVLAFILNLYTVQLSEDKRRTQVVWIVRIQKAWRLSVRPNCMLIACDIVRTKFRFSFPSVIFYGRMFEDSE